MVDAHKYLTKDGAVATANNWVECLKSYVEFQRQANFPEHGPSLPTAVRPVEIGEWMKHGRQQDINIRDTDDFQQRWWDWWLSLQPKSRVCASTAPSSKMNWSGLQKHGKNGFFLIMVSLMWWGKASNQSTEWVCAVEDVVAVLYCLNSIPTKATEAANPPDAANAARPKRALKRSRRGEEADKCGGVSKKRH
jgi:hypothetical protein